MKRLSDLRGREDEDEEEEEESEYESRAVGRWKSNVYLCGGILLLRLPLERR